MADLVAAVADDRLDRATPCPAYTVGDLIEHIGGLAVAFTAAASKSVGAEGSRPPSGDASRLGEEWRTRIPRDLTGLARAWQNPEAWTGVTSVGGLDLPGEVAGLVALDELVIHGWDLAQASGHRYHCDKPSLEAVYGFVVQFSGPDQEESRRGLFGPVVDIGADAPRLDQVIGLAGRDPGWSRA
jgi:uncharacterized protein (TIGR03086 family)